jgi:hypothetical protein
MVTLGEKLGGGPTDHSVGLGVVSGALYLKSSRVHPMLLMACERLSRTWTARRKAYAGRTWTGVESVHVVCIGFSPTGCTSIRNAVTLGYELWNCFT